MMRFCAIRLFGPRRAFSRRGAIFRERAGGNAPARKYNRRAPAPGRRAAHAAHSAPHAPACAVTPVTPQRAPRKHDDDCACLQRAAAFIIALFSALWCSWLTRRPLKAETAGSSPASAITNPQLNTYARQQRSQERLSGHASRDSRWPAEKDDPVPPPAKARRERLLQVLPKNRDH